ncbi:hypothetical protein CDAR_591261 [Caerostris darwini]|uniref:Uncharacterized protein n=1 Tax=Caerostris darwini TaxID=1538125 RepID=A0AAV4RPN6_9ARAC|nr:hypothetical protein CDAR_591261 [Caerostris darwini]
MGNFTLMDKIRYAKSYRIDECSSPGGNVNCLLSSSIYHQKQIYFSKADKHGAAGVVGRGNTAPNLIKNCCVESSGKRRLGTGKRPDYFANHLTLVRTLFHYTLVTPYEKQVSL